MPRLLALFVALVALVALAVPSSARAAPEELTELAKRLSPSVVVLKVEDARGGKLGTGFFVSEDGRVITNHHVIAGAQNVTATMIDGTTVRVLGMLADDAEDDLAILQVEGHGPWPALKLGEKVEQGEEIVVIGSPKGLGNTFTNGIISRVSEEGTAFDESDGSRTRFRSWVIGITAAVSPGSSGSPVMNRNGDVIAIAVGKSGDPRDEGLNFAIPISFAKRMLDPLAGDAKPKPFAVVKDDYLARNLIISGSVVAGIAILFFLWGWLESRRARPKPRLD